MTRTAKEGQNPVIGILTFKTKLIQRKFDSEVIWDEVNSGIDIRNRDTVRTGDYSDALLTLNDKSKININENSMIYLDFSDSAIINFAYGSLSLVSTGEKGDEEHPTKELKIASGDKLLEVGKSSLNLAKSGKDDLKLQVTEGSTKIISNGKETTLNENEVANMSSSGIEISAVNLFPDNPIDQQKIYSKTPKAIVDFDWTTSQNAEDVKLEVSKDSKFSSIVSNVPVKGTSTQLSLDSGSYYWRLTSNIKTQKQREISVIRKLYLYSVTPPIFTLPEEGKIFKYSTISPLVELGWKKNELFKDYSVEVSKDSSFSEIIKKVPSSSNYVTIDNLSDGKYFARILAYPVSPDLTIETSGTLSFSLESSSIPDPPKLISPINNTKIMALSIEKGITTFQWKDNPETKESIFQISQSKKFDSIVFEQKVTSNLIKPISKFNPGIYFWRVKAVNKQDKGSDFSEIFNFEVKEIDRIELVFPQDKNSFKLDSDGITFLWKKNELASNYLIEIATDPNFSKIVTSFKGNSTSFKYKFSNEGEFFWRVVLFGDDSSELTKSSVYSLVIENSKDITLLYPRENDRIDMTNYDELIFKWEKMPNIDYYLLELTDNSGKQIIPPIKITNNQFILKDITKLEEGSFKWNIQTVSKKADSEMISKKTIGNFKIYLSEKPILPMVKAQKKFYVE
jgi:hypothetical protein